MALILTRSRFIHVPKTGGTWVTEALRRGCTVREEFTVEGSLHSTLRETPQPELFSFAFVREPLGWWESLWRFHKGPARRYVVSHKVCSLAWSDDFGEFVRNVLRWFPGEYRRVIDYYIGGIGAGIDFVGRQENLVDDLLLALELADEPHDAAVIRAVAKANVSDRGAAADCGAELAMALRLAERDVVARFGYDGVPADPAAMEAWLQWPRRPSPEPRVAAAASPEADVYLPRSPAPVAPSTGAGAGAGTGAGCGVAGRMP